MENSTPQNTQSPNKKRAQLASLIVLAILAILSTVAQNNPKEPNSPLITNPTSILVVTNQIFIFSGVTVAHIVKLSPNSFPNYQLKPKIKLISIPSKFGATKIIKLS